MSETSHTNECDGTLDEALAEVGRQARSLGACSICWALVAPGLRDQHLDWHASLVREVERERLPLVYGGPASSPAEPLRYADGCVGEHDPDGNPICAGRLNPDWHASPPDKNGSEETS